MRSENEKQLYKKFYDIIEKFVGLDVIEEYVETIDFWDKINEMYIDDKNSENPSFYHLIDQIGFKNFVYNLADDLCFINGIEICKTQKEPIYKSISGVQELRYWNWNSMTDYEKDTWNKIQKCRGRGVRNLEWHSYAPFFIWKYENKIYCTNIDTFDILCVNNGCEKIGKWIDGKPILFN